MKIICIGRNYPDHIQELKNEQPQDPVIFLKPKTALLAAGQAFYYPSFSADLHYEVELVLKIARNGKHIAKKFAHKYLEEITVGIDFTARDIQERQKRNGLPWEIAKAFDQSAVVGKFMAISELPNPENILFSLKKNDDIVQKGESRLMLFSFEKVIAYVSQFFTLNKGDLLFTGTPAGVGSIKIGDHLEGFLFDEKQLEVTIK